MQSVILEHPWIVAPWARRVLSVCSEKDGQCHLTTIADGAECEDGSYCTVDTFCAAGECLGAPRDCSASADQCNAGVCDDEADACVSRPLSDGATCDDAAFCTVADSCTAGVCAGSLRDCSGSSDQCNFGTCDESTDACLPIARVDGTSCDDGLYCSANDTCAAGTCVAGPARQCGAAGGSCRTGVCDETTDSCSGDPVADGTSCDDGQYCTLGDQCLAGTCAGGAARGCPGDACNDGVCNDILNTCLTQAMTDGTACSDGKFCTANDSCTAGVCSGGARDCSQASDSCNSGVCDEMADACLGQPVSDGVACPDGLFCTVGDTCQAGTCQSQPRDCATAADQCNSGICDEAGNICVPQPRSDGTSCNDGDFCVVGESCVAGACVGSAMDCSALGGECATGACDEVTDRCLSAARPDGLACDDGEWCTDADACLAGTCTGTIKSCGGAGDQCNLGFCDEPNDRCDNTPRADGTSCADSLFCTVNEACQAGSCVNVTMRDCSSVGDQCNVGACDEAANACAPSPKPDNSACDDAQFCTDADRCVSGACLGGGPLDCSVADSCLVGSCDELGNKCETTPNAVCCDVNADADLDGANECDDCDDSNGSVYPGAAERCNGFDDDCDGQIDEDFDVDGDGYSICSTNPALFDCDDSNAQVNPGMLENCGPGNLGNGIDDDCDGYIDEGCNPCTTNDQDNDGWSECDGDCDDNDQSTFPGALEVCDGDDNDCNIYTRPNCGVSNACNHDLDGDFSNDSDVCQDDMLCACLISGRTCTGNWRCTSFCNSSDTGPLGDGCGVDQTCGLDLRYSANIHGCNVNTDTPGSTRGGAACSKDSNCRSLECDKLCVGAGCNQKYCTDLCTSDAECATGAICRVSTTTGINPNMDGRCWPAGGVFTGPSAVGNTCTANADCDHTLCVTDPNTAAKYCSESCCTSSDCDSGYTCSFRGNGVDANVVFTPPGAASCTLNSDCTGAGAYCFNNSCGWRVVETTGQCVRDVVNQGSRVAGQACATNSQCESNFCEQDLGICISACCADSTCPTGLTCQKAFIQTTANRATQGRVCLNLSSDDLLQRK